MMVFGSVMRPYKFCWAVVALTLASVPVRAAIVDFEEPDVAFGTVYGVNAVPPNNLEDVVLIQNGIEMSVQGFLTSTPDELFFVFNEAVVGGQFFETFPELFDSTPLELDNISVLFDFRNADVLNSAPATSVTVGFHHFDGTLNLRVNNETLWNNFSDFNDLPSEVANGIELTVEDNLLTLTATDGTPGIRSLWIGGQELTIDDINAVPEPSVLVLMGIGAGGLAIRRWKARCAN